MRRPRLLPNRYVRAPCALAIGRLPRPSPSGCRGTAGGSRSRRPASRRARPRRRSASARSGRARPARRLRRGRHARTHHDGRQDHIVRAGCEVGGGEAQPLRAMRELVTAAAERLRRRRAARPSRAPTPSEARQRPATGSETVNDPSPSRPGARPAPASATAGNEPAEQAGDDRRMLATTAASRCAPELRTNAPMSSQEIAPFVPAGNRAAGVAATAARTHASQYSPAKIRSNGAGGRLASGERRRTITRKGARARHDVVDLDARRDRKSLPSAPRTWRRRRSVAPSVAASRRNQRLP